jgi:prepilin-type N-terminal cleavage/methylation domain-containing protein
MKANEKSVLGRRSGFSLMELLIVLVVAGLLSGLSLSAYGGLRNIMAERESWLRFTEVTQAVRLYELEQGQWPDWLAQGEAELTASSGWLDSLSAYYEGPFARGEVSDGFGHRRVFIVADLDGDRWIHAEDFRELAEAERPQRLHARIVAYSLDAEGRLATSTWK